MLNNIKTFISKHVKGVIEHSKWLFRSPSISFDTAPNFKQILKEKNFSELKKYLPEYMVGSKKLSRLQSFLLLGIAVLIGVMIHSVFGFIIMLAITYGSLYTYSEYSTYISIAMLDSTHFVVAYSGNSNYGYCRIGTVSGTTISYGSAYQWTTNVATTYNSVVAIDSTHFVVLGNYSNYYNARFGTVSGSTISYGTVASDWSGSGTYYIMGHKIDSTHLLVSHKNGNYFTHRVMTISGTTLTWGTMYDSSTFSVNERIALDMLSSTKFIAVYQNNSGNGRAYIGTISGTTVTYAGDVEFAYADMGRTHSVMKIDATHAVIARSAYNDTSGGKCCVVTMSGSSLSFGSSVAFSSGNINYISGTLIDSNNFVVTYRGNDTYGYCVLGKISGTTITFDSPVVMNAVATNYNDIATLDSTHFIAGYQNNTDGYGYGIIGNVPPPLPPTVTTENVDQILNTSARGNGTVVADNGNAITERGLCWGTSHNPTTAGSKVIVAGTTGSFVGSLTSLSEGTLYYVRAYATNIGGTTYGNEVSFTSDSSSTPEVDIISIANIFKTSCAGTLKITDYDYSNSDKIGFVWDTVSKAYPSSATPEASGYASFVRKSGTFLQDVNYLMPIGGLLEGVEYYIRAFAKNASGYNYSDEETFTTDYNIVIDELIPAGSLLNVETEFTIKGSHFKTGATVTIDGELCTDIVVVDENTITAVSPISTVQKSSELIVENTDSKQGIANFFYMSEVPPPTILPAVTANFEVEVISVLR